MPRVHGRIGAAFAVMLLACRGAAGPVEADTQGWLMVRTTTSGEPIPGAVAAAVGNDSRTIGTNGLVVFASLTPGIHTVRLTGVPTLCDLIGAAERSVTVAPSDTIEVTFELTCPVVGSERILVFIAGQLATMTEYATRSRALTSAGQNYFAAISPDGQRVAFTSNRDGDEEIYVMNADGSDQRNLTQSPDTRDSWPRWSPDGTRIAFYSWRTTKGPSSGEIYLLDVTATGTWTRLTSNNVLDADPEWSPDGTRLLFMSERDGNQEVYVMNIDGSGVERLTDDPALDGNPAWSPDGSRIAFATSRYQGGDDYDVAVMAPDGTGVTRITTDTGIDVRPIWSPDGQRIMYSHRVAQGNYDVWIVTVDGSDAREVLTGAENEQGDDWGVPAQTSLVGAITPR